VKIVVDTSVLVFLADPHAAAPLDTKTGKPVPHCTERIEGLIEGLDESGAVMVIPTPVLSELLICVGNAQAEVLATVTGKRSVVVAPFDQMAAVENAQLRRSKASRKKRGETKKEVSFDLQILAIALTDDRNLRRRCLQTGMKVKGIADLALPDSKRQMLLLASESNDDDEPEDRENAPSAE
jgi:predicted nucleic acid-binding protein